MVLLAAPTPVETPPPALAITEQLSPWTSCQHTWYAGDGTEWDLSHGLSGLALQAGVRGMRPPPLTRYVTKMPAVAGSVYRGAVADEREIFWPIKVFAYAGSQEWIQHNKRFWATLDEDIPGVWVITQPDGTRRSLTCRYVGLEDDSDDIDPSLVGWCTYGIRMAAEQPYWVGDPISRTFQTVSATDNYYGGAGGSGFGPPYVTLPASTTATSSIANPGDVKLRPVWQVNGPCTSATVGLGGQTITFPMALTAGQYVRLDTDPTDQVALDHAGVDRTAQLVLAGGGFGEIPRGGEEVPLTVTIIGTGKVSITITPKYKAALS